MDFEWDEPKRRRNIRDHGVDFADAALIFLNPVVEALGHVDDAFYMVAYTPRGTVRRIISAWRVDDEGQRRYAAILRRNA